MKSILVAISLALLVIAVNCQSETTTSKITSVLSSTTTPIYDECNQNSTSCEDCLKKSNCFFCDADNQCKTYSKGIIFPDNCPASKARWLDCPFCCSLDLQALIIAVCVVGGVILLIMACCICYCCNKTCKAMSDRNLSKIEKKIAKQKEALRQKTEARKVERQTKNDAIRVKYGLKPSTYTQIEN